MARPKASALALIPRLSLRKSPAPVNPGASYPFRLSAGGWSVLVDICDRSNDPRAPTERIVRTSRRTFRSSSEEGRLSSRRSQSSIHENESRFDACFCRAAATATGAGSRPKALFPAEIDSPSTALAHGVTTIVLLDPVHDVDEHLSSQGS